MSIFSKGLSLLTKWDKRWQHQPLISAIYTTYRKIFTILVIDVYAHIIALLFLLPNALFPTILDYQLPFYTPIVQNIVLIIDIITMTFFSTLLAKEYYQRRRPDHDATLIMMTMFYSTMTSFQNQNNFNVILIKNYFILILLVYAVVNSYILYQKLLKQPQNPLSFANIGWAAIIITIATVLKPFLHSAALQATINQYLSSSIFNHIPAILIFALILPLLSWIGISIPSDLLVSQASATAISENLNFFLTKHTTAHIPYPINLYNTFSMFSIVGGLALCLLLLFRSRNIGDQRLGQWSLLPSLFNNHQLLLFAYPLLLRPLFLIPMLVSPVVTTSLGYLAVKLHIITIPVYQVPLSTPYLIRAYLATNGNLIALAVSILLIIVSVLIYLPFFNVAMKSQKES